jgi:hypothetical protein
MKSTLCDKFLIRAASIVRCNKFKWKSWNKFDSKEDYCIDSDGNVDILIDVLLRNHWSMHLHDFCCLYMEISLQTLVSYQTESLSQKHTILCWNRMPYWARIHATSSHIFSNILKWPVTRTVYPCVIIDDDVTCTPTEFEGWEAPCQVGKIFQVSGFREKHGYHNSCNCHFGDLNTSFNLLNLTTHQGMHLSTKTWENIQVVQYLAWARHNILYIKGNLPMSKASTPSSFRSVCCSDVVWYAARSQVGKFGIAFDLIHLEWVQKIECSKSLHFYYIDYIHAPKPLIHGFVHSLNHNSHIVLHKFVRCLSI